MSLGNNTQGYSKATDLAVDLPSLQRQGIDGDEYVRGY
jgi:hypothetical protein